MRYLTRLSLGLAVLLLAACASQTPTDATVQKPKERNSDEAYTYQTSLGSRIPRKVKKSQATTSEEQTEETQDALREAQMRGTSTPGGN